ncbi:MAG: branched-chain amino acid ABC transporter permease [Chloroflexi bacterium]|nr:branched-chain amino acid ABC transporter permease [Chloroflexota bacterium]
MTGLSLERTSLRRATIIIVVLGVLCIVAPLVLSTFWVQILTSVAIYSIVTLSLALLAGRVGLVSLGQIALLAVAGWIALRLAFAFNPPYPVLLLVTGVLTAIVGTLIGLPALRLSGLYLALITLMAASAITQILAAVNFPNGGPGFLGESASAAGNNAAIVTRPDWMASDAAFFRAVVIVAALMFLLGVLHVHGKAGRAWAAIRQSESAAIAAGVNVTQYKLWAFALASFMTGIAGCLLAASAGGLTTYAFPAPDSITILAVVLMGGIFNFWGAIVAAVLMKLFPEILKNFRIPADVLTIMFGVGVLQAMTTAPSGISVQMGRDLTNLGRRIGRLAGRGSTAGTSL